MVENNGSLLGVLMDITQELAEKRRLEYERDYDLLTTLLNRRAFYDRVKRLFEHPQQMGIAALIMIDLDNLKYINDTYGLDCGDEYIRAAASVLRGVSSSQIITARMSGDEFFIFCQGYSSHLSVRNFRPVRCCCLMERRFGCAPLWELPGIQVIRIICRT